MGTLGKHWKLNHEKWRNLRPVKSGGGDTYVK